MLSKYIKNVALIIEDLNPLEKEIYIKKISETIGIKEQSIYDLLNKEMQNNTNKFLNMNSDYNFGYKLYREPSYIKAERSILKFMHINNTVYDYVEQNYSKDYLVLESHKKIYELIKEYINLDINEREKHIELMCNDIESSKEWINLLQIDLKYEEDGVTKFIDDCFKEIEKYRLEQKVIYIKNKIKEFEKNGQLEDSLKLTQELANIQEKISSL